MVWAPILIAAATLASLSPRAASFHLSLPAINRAVKAARKATTDGNDPPQAADKHEEYRGSKKWTGLIPAVEEPRKWDEGFRAFLLKYGMINHVVYDVFITGDDDDRDEHGLRGTSRFDNDFERFTEKGLQFNYLDKLRERKIEYDFRDEYHVIGNLVGSARSFFTGEDNWFGFVMLSNDGKELVIVFRGTKTTKEWVENATCSMQQLDGEPEESGLELFFNTNVMMATMNLMVHVGFQSLYTLESAQGGESPKETIHRLIKEHKPTLDKVTVVGHSLGGAVSQLCAVDLARSNVLGDIPILGIAFAPPKVCNKYLADWVDSMHPKLRVLRVYGPNDLVPKVPPGWLWAMFTGGYHHMGTEVLLSNAHLRDQGLVMKEGVGSNHNLEMYLYNIDPTRDLALLNKCGSCIPDEYCDKHGISPSWHSLTWPRTIFD